ncbi:PRD domain-containing protein [Enterococcus faecium]|uniref:PRD domain-containing protein n=1 Tax=Enterococcus faecium TaxID=1352 RepID=UPI0010FBC54C|nr:PRD domain-containing protein [Enterococcus faecium]QCS45666.1 PRD domain-containing protein [Enterococcus faecium]
MYIKQILNNNAVLVKENNQELILQGSGIGFQKKIGDAVADDKIQKKFILEGDSRSNDIAHIYKSLSASETNTVFEIILLAETKLKTKLSSSIYLSLADHLHYAISRYKQGITLKSPLSLEIKNIYPSEYEIGLQALTIIKKNLVVTFSTDEAISIALHILNAERITINTPSLEDTYREAKIIQDIVEIIRLHFGLIFDTKQHSYQRLLFHLRFFSKNITDGFSSVKEESILYENVKTNYLQSFECTKKISNYLQRNHRYKLTKNEHVYLTIHIQKILQENQTNIK